MTTVTTRKHGRGYSYRFAVTENGKRKFHEKGGFATKEEAYAAGIAALTDWRHGNIGITSERVKFKDYAALWLSNVARLNVRTTTYLRYQRELALYLDPYIGETGLQALTPSLLDNVMRKLATRGLAYGTIKNAWTLLGSILDHAIYPGKLLTSNPASFIKVPRSAPRSVIKRSIVTPAEYEELLRAAPFGNTLHVPLALLYHTGMRTGEVLGLCWEDVDLQRGIITVRRQLVARGDYCALTPPKTKSSERVILIDDALVSLLKRWKEQQESNEAALGTSYCIVDEQADHTIKTYSKSFATGETNRQDLVCTTRKGRPAGRSTLTYFLHKFCLNAHSFRHTHATMLIEAGASPKGVAGRLGHKNINITENLYTHQTQQMQRDTLAVLEKKLWANGICGQNEGNEN